MKQNDTRRNTYAGLVSADRPASMTVSGFGRPLVRWLPDPGPETVPHAVNAFVQHRIATHLRLAGFTAKRLSDAVGESRTSWSNKLNGVRTFSIADIAAIAIAVDPRIWDALPRDVTGPTDVLPAEYVPLLSHARLGDGMPQFRASDVSLAAARFNAWWAAEVAAGRQWALTVDVARQRAAIELDGCGLPSREASVGSDSVAQRTVEWIARATRLRFLWLGSREETSPTVAESMKAFGELLWGSHTGAPMREIVVVAAPPTIVHNFEAALDLAESDYPGTVTVSLQAAHSLGLVGVSSDLPDLDLTIHCWESTAPLWIELKA